MKTLACRIWAGALLASFSLGLVSQINAATNVILIIGDGMGYGHLEIGRRYMGKNFCFESFYRNDSHTALPSGGVTDSSTAGTALATGYQHPENDTISTDTGDKPVQTILEKARAAGMKVGIVTTDDIAGATPGAFGAHEPSRNYMAEIRYDYIKDDTDHPASLPDVLLGGGSAAGGDYTWAAAMAGYVAVGKAAELDVYSQPDRLLGLFAPGVMTVEYDRTEATLEPKLSAMTTKALERLQANNGSGFFLVVESANIDKISHNGSLPRTAYVALEMREFDATVQAAKSWASQNPQDKTLILVTADHETGGVQINTSGEITFTTTGHTTAKVPLFSNLNIGFTGMTVENEETFFIMEDFLFPTPLPEAPGTPTGLTATAGNNQVTLSWTGSLLAGSYDVYRGLTPEGLSKLAETSNTTYTDSSAENGTTYYYAVTALNAGGASALTQAVSATPQGPPAIPLGLTPKLIGTQVSLKWNASSGASGYRVKRASGKTARTYAQIAEVTLPEHLDVTTVAGVTYYYVVTAYNNYGESGQSPPVKITVTKPRRNTTSPVTASVVPRATAVQ